MCERVEICKRIELPRLSSRGKGVSLIRTLNGILFRFNGFGDQRNVRGVGDECGVEKSLGK